VARKKERGGQGLPVDNLTHGGKGGREQGSVRSRTFSHEVTIQVGEWVAYLQGGKKEGTSNNDLTRDIKDNSGNCERV